MKIKVKYLLELTQDEAESLKVLLGNYSDVQAEEWGLSKEKIKKLHELYDSLPFAEESEEK